MKHHFILLLIGMLTVLLDIFLFGETGSAGPKAEILARTGRYQQTAVNVGKPKGLNLSDFEGKPGTQSAGKLPSAGVQAVSSSIFSYKLFLKERKILQQKKEAVLVVEKQKSQEKLKRKGAVDQQKNLNSQPAGTVNRIAFLSTSVSIVDCQNAAEAPSGQVAGFWQGDGSTTDGQPTHIIGHSPGVFDQELQLNVGDTITIWDRNGQRRDYTVYETLDVNDDAYDRQGNVQWDSILHQPGESISLQACIDDYWNRMVLAR